MNSRVSRQCSYTIGFTFFESVFLSLVYINWYLFSNLSVIFRRLYFLGIPPKQRECTMMYINVPETPMTITPALTWCQLLESFNSALSTNTQMSKEEQLLRERERFVDFYWAREKVL